MSSSFVLVMAPPGLEPSASDFTTGSAQSFDRLTDAVFAAQVKADVGNLPWIASDGLIFTPDHVMVIFKRVLAEMGKALSDTDGT